MMSEGGVGLVLGDTVYRTTFCWILECSGLASFPYKCGILCIKRMYCSKLFPRFCDALVIQELFSVTSPQEWLVSFQNSNHTLIAVHICSGIDR